MTEAERQALRDMVTFLRENSLRCQVEEKNAITEYSKGVRRGTASAYRRIAGMIELQFLPDDAEHRRNASPE